MYQKELSDMSPEFKEKGYDFVEKVKFYLNTFIKIERTIAIRLRRIAVIINQWGTKVVRGSGLPDIL
jgi:hypothetical protein